MEVLDFIKKGLVADVKDFSRLAAVPAGLVEYVGDHLSFNMIENFLSDFFERQRVILGTVFKIEVDQVTVNQRRDVTGIAVP